MIASAFRRMGLALALTGAVCGVLGGCAKSSGDGAVVLKVASQSATMNEVPMILRYDLKQGESKMNVQKTMKQTLKLLLDFKMGRLNP